MADSRNLFTEEIAEETSADIEMAGDDTIAQVEIPAPAVIAAEDGDILPFQEEPLEDVSARVTYIDYLKSPIIGLLVGQGDEQALLTAHQALLVTSPWFADACGKFSDDVSVRHLYLLRGSNMPDFKYRSDELISLTKISTPLGASLSFCILVITFRER